MKKNNIKTRIIATVLSVITVFSVGTIAITSANAASIGNAGGAAAYGAGMGIIRQYVPGGQAIAGLLDPILGSLINDGPSLSDVNNNIDKLRSEVTAQFNDIKKQMKDDKQQIEAKIVNQTVIATKGNSFDALMTSMKDTADQINTLRNDPKLNQNETAVEIAALIGRNDAWTQSSNLHNKYLSFLDTLCSKSFADQNNRDFCQVVYQDCASQVMFSGEAKDAAKPYLDRVLYLGLYAYSIDAQCLKAAQQISNFTDADVKTLDKDALNKYNNLKSRASVVNMELNKINNDLFDTDGTNSVISHYRDFNNINRLIFINQNKSNQPFKADLKSYQHNKSSKGTDAYNNIKSQICANTMSKDDMSTLMSYIAQKNMTVRDYLKKVGFNVNSLPSKSYLTYKDGASEEKITQAFTYGSIYQCNGYYLDKNGTSEDTVIFRFIVLVDWKEDVWNPDCCAVAFVPA